MFVTKYPPFRPFPYLSNGHVQTLLPFLHKTERARTPTQRYVVRLDDGDVLTIHDNIPQKWITGDRIVVLVHGMCGSHRSNYMRRTGEKLRRHGFRTIRVDLRGQGDSQLLSRGHSHAGATGDVECVIRAVLSLSPLSYITVIGYSLGGNMVLKMCGQWSGEPHPQVDSIIAIAPPIDLVHCSANLRQWGNRLYDLYFCRQIARNILFRRRHLPGLVDNGLLKMPNRLVHLDDQFIAPTSGFDGARDYYFQSSSAPVLRNISVSTLIVAAQDDPIVPFDMYRHWVMSPDIELLSFQYGGHLGFFGSSPGDPDRHWLEWRLVAWLDDFDQQQIKRRAREARESMTRQKQD